MALDIKVYETNVKCFLKPDNTNRSECGNEAKIYLFMKTCMVASMLIVAIHITAHLHKKQMIARLPKKLQRDLVTHLYSDILRKVLHVFIIVQVADACLKICFLNGFP